jgi:hypothetical protein
VPHTLVESCGAHPDQYVTVPDGGTADGLDGEEVW